jgi:hypothetical protein
MSHSLKKQLIAAAFISTCILDCGSTPPFSGSYSGTWTVSFTPTGQTAVTLSETQFTMVMTQIGQNVSGTFLVNGTAANSTTIAGTVTGTVSGTTLSPLTFTIPAYSPCAGSFSGTGTLTSTTFTTQITGTVTGSTGAVACGPNASTLAGALSGTISLTLTPE